MPDEYTSAAVLSEEMIVEKPLLIANYAHRIIWFEGSIMKGFSDKLKFILARMNRRCTAMPIWFYVWSGGGSMDEMLHAVQLVDASKSPVVWIGFNTVASAALVLMQSGTAAYALTKTRLRFHQTRDELSNLPSRTFITRQAYMDRLWELARSDAFVLQQLGRRADARIVSELLEQEACIRPAQAIRIGMLSGYFDMGQFKEDRCHIRKQWRALKEKAIRRRS